MNELFFVYNVKKDEEITKHIIRMNQQFNFDQVYSSINDHHSSSTIVTPDKQMSVAFDYRSSPGGHAGMTDMMLSRIYPNYQRCKIYGDENVYFDNLDKNVFILTMKALLIILTPPKINEYQYQQIIAYVNRLKNTEYAKTGKIDSVFINDDEFPFSELDEKLALLKSHIASLPIPDEYPFDEIKDESEIVTYYHHKVR